MKIIAAIHIWDRIAEFYINAKRLKYGSAYSWDKVIKDIELAQSDTNFTPCGASKQEWIDAGYNVVRNARNWAFAYQMQNEIMYIYDVENCKYLDVPIKSQNNLNTYNQLSSVKSAQQPRGFAMGYGFSAYRADNGFIYLYKNRQRIQDYWFNEIEKNFCKYKNGEIYAIGVYGDKRFKIYYLKDKDQIKVIQESRRQTLRLTESQFMEMLTECISEIIRKIA